MQHVKVTCRSEYCYAQEPVAFELEHDRIEIKAIVQSWREPAGPAFLVQDTNGIVYRIMYQEAEDAWQAEVTG